MSVNVFRMVEFPVDGLDVSAYCAGTCGDGRMNIVCATVCIYTTSLSVYTVFFVMTI
jgi:hypothetical protein